MANLKEARSGKQKGKLETKPIVHSDKETKEKYCSVNFEVLRATAEKDVLIGGIIKKRIDQVKPFCKISRDNDLRGFRVTNKDGEIDDKAEEYMDFFMNTGFGDNMEEDREDDFADVVDKMVRDLLTIDQLAIELRRSESGDVYDFWVLDGATIKRANQEELDGKKIKFVQTVRKDFQEDEKIYFAKDEIIFDYMNKRSDVKHWGYGYAPVEQCIDVVTTFLFGMSYNRDIFSKDKIPKGFIKMMGDVSPQTILSVQKYWHQQMSGYGARFKVPIIPSGKDGVGMDFVKLDQTARDMEYDKLMDLVMSLQATVFGIDLLELGLKLDKASQVIGESGEPRLQHSKDSGLSSIVIFLETLFNKILRQVNPDYKFEFVGIKDEDKKAEADLKKTRLETIMSIDELREEDGLKPFGKPWSQVPLHPQAVQMIQAEAQNAMMDGGGEEGDDEWADGDSEDDDGELDWDSDEEDNDEDMPEVDAELEEDTAQKSLQKSKSNKIIVI